MRRPTPAIYAQAIDTLDATRREWRAAYDKERKGRNVRDYQPVRDGISKSTANDHARGLFNRQATWETVSEYPHEVRQRFRALVYEYQLAERLRRAVRPFRVGQHVRDVEGHVRGTVKALDPDYGTVTVIGAKDRSTWDIDARYLEVLTP